MVRISRKNTAARQLRKWGVMGALAPYSNIIVLFGEHQKSPSFNRSVPMKTSVLFVVLLVTPLLHAGDPEGFALWKGAAIKKSSTDLSGKMDDQKFAWESLG